MPRGRKPAIVLDSPAVTVAHKGAGVREPADLSVTAAAKWRVLVPLIAQGCDLKDTDTDALVQYCEAVVMRARAAKELEGAPLVLITPNGAQQVNPLFKIISQQEAVMMKLSERFGLDPASRKRLKMAAEAATEDPMSEFIADGRSIREAEAGQG